MAIFDPTGARATVPTGPTGIAIPSTRAPNLVAPAAGTLPNRSVMRPGGIYTGGLYNTGRRFNRGGTRF